MSRPAEMISATRRPVRISDQPAAAKRRAAARPKPEVAPVMKMILDMGDKPLFSENLRASVPNP